MSILDPVADMRLAIRSHLESLGAPSRAIVDDYAIDPAVRWRPHVWDAEESRAWHCATPDADPESWITRMERARRARPGLKLGVCGGAAVIASVLNQLDELEAAILVMPSTEDEGMPRGLHRSATACDFIYEQRIALDQGLARTILDRNYARALAATTNEEKGVRLEIVSAVALSQVTGYHIGQHDISNRSQQMDLIVVNRNASGILAGGSVVVAEVKNWQSIPVTPNEYYGLMRKVESRHGRAKLGVLITSGRFTAGIETEAARDSMRDVMILRLDGTTFPALWRGGLSISEQYEREMMSAIAGQ